MKAFCPWTRSTYELVDMTLLMLDTNIISDMMRNPHGPAMQRSAKKLEEDPKAESCTSLVVNCELLFGLTQRPSPRLLAAYDRVMATLEVLPIDVELAPVYARLRGHMESQGFAMGPNDLLIAAHALTVNATLISADAAFARVPGLQVENWLADFSKPT